MFVVALVQGQESNLLSPQFEGCENQNPIAIKESFYQKIQQFVFDNFQMPDVVVKNNYKGIVNVLFEVDTVGVFRVQYVDAIYPELATETKRVLECYQKSNRQCKMESQILSNIILKLLFL